MDRDDRADLTRPLRVDAARNRARLIEAGKAALSASGADVSLEAVAKSAGVGIGTLYRHFPTRDKLIEAIYRSELQVLVDAAPRFLDAMTPVEALRAWMRLSVDYLAEKQAMAPVLTSLASGTSELYVETGALIKAAIGLLVERAADAGEIRLDIEPFDLIRALVGVAGISAAPGWEESAKRLVDILIAGMRVRPDQG